MNMGMMEGTCYRGRALISATVKTDVAEPRTVALGDGKLGAPLREELRPKNAPYIVRLLVLEGNSLPETKGAVMRDPELSVRLSMGDYTKQTQGMSSENGSARWYEELEIHAEFPNDVSQVPDIFVDLYKNDKRLSFRRFPVHQERESDGQPHTGKGYPPSSGVHEDLLTLRQMVTADHVPVCAWYTLKRDLFGVCEKDEFPGSLLLCIGIQLPEGGTTTRKVGTPRRKAPPTPRKKSAEEDDDLPPPDEPPPDEALPPAAASQPEPDTGADEARSKEAKRAGWEAKLKLKETARRACTRAPCLRPSMTMPLKFMFGSPLSRCGATGHGRAEGQGGQDAGRDEAPVEGERVRGQEPQGCGDVRHDGPLRQAHAGHLHGTTAAHHRDEDQGRQKRRRKARSVAPLSSCPRGSALSGR